MTDTSLLSFSNYTFVYLFVFRSSFVHLSLLFSEAELSTQDVQKYKFIGDETAKDLKVALEAKRWG